MIFNTSSQYGVVSKLLHWLNALLMPPMIIIGYYQTTLSDENPLYFRLLDLHQATGLFILCLFMIKLAWRTISPNPDLSTVSSGLALRLAYSVHILLFSAMAGLPVLGYLFATAQGDGIPFFGLFEIPGLIELDKTTAENVIALHAVLAYSIAVLIILHIAAALKHHYIDGSDAFRRIWR